MPYQGSAKYRHRNRPAALLSHHPVHVTSDARLYIHPCMQSLSPHSEREERQQQHRRFLLARKRNIFPSSPLSPSGSSQLFFPGPLERIKRVTWLAIGPGVRIYLRKIVFGVCVCVILASSVWQQQARSNERLPCIDHVLVGTLATEFFSIVAEKSCNFSTFIIFFLLQFGRSRKLGHCFLYLIVCFFCFWCVFLDFSRPDYFLVRIRGIRFVRVAALLDR